MKFLLATNLPLFPDRGGANEVDRLLLESHRGLPTCLEAEAAPLNLFGARSFLRLGRSSTPVSA